jgi:hypothetical protein
MNPQSQVEVPKDAVRKAWAGLPGITHREVAEALQAAAPAIRAQERERVQNFIEKVEFEVGCMQHYAKGRRDTLGKLAREIAEPLETALAEIKEEPADA